MYGCFLLSVVHGVLFAQKQGENAKPEADLKYDLPTYFINLPKHKLRLSYTDTGIGGKAMPVILMLHDVEGNLAHFQPIIQILRKQYRCIAIDLPGHGKTTKLAQPYTLKFLSDIILDFMDVNDIWDVTLAGHGFGGQLAAYFTTKHYARVNHLVLLAPRGFEMFTPVEIDLLTRPTRADSILTRQEVHIEKDIINQFFKMPDEAKVLVENRKKMRSTGAYGYYSAGAENLYNISFQEFQLKNLAEVKVPVLLLLALDDKVVPNRTVRTEVNPNQFAASIAQALPNCKYVIVPGAGHLLQYEQPQAVASHIASFVASKR